jgi:hypothetical protein
MGRRRPRRQGCRALTISPLLDTDGSKVRRPDRPRAVAVRRVGVLVAVLFIGLPARGQILEPAAEIQATSASGDRAGLPAQWHTEPVADTRLSRVQPAQFLLPPSAEPLAPPPLAPVLGSEKRIQVGPRSNALIHIKSFPGTLPNQSVTVFSNGIRAVIEGVETAALGNLGRIVIETDRLVLWGPTLRTLSPPARRPLEDRNCRLRCTWKGTLSFAKGID